MNALFVSMAQEPYLDTRLCSTTMFVLQVADTGGCSWQGESIKH